jgi:type II secretory ATPase GspE/PulE/Tfp pilus assembly ATPase PilB-like protein
MPDQDKTAQVKEIYSRLDRKFEEEETEKKASKSKLAYIDLSRFPIDERALELIPQSEAENLQAIVFYKEGKIVKIGFTQLSPQLQQKFTQLKGQNYSVEGYLISHSSFYSFFQGYKKVVFTPNISNAIDLSQTNFGFSSLKDLAVNFEGQTATQVIDKILGAAISIEASDIHIEPEAKNAKLRLRIDGVLQDNGSISSLLYHQLVSRIKIISKLKLNVVATPQDGSFGLTFEKAHIDIRVSVIPSAYGESIVMRILRQDKGLIKFEELGIMGVASDRILSELKKTNGMILSTGPTGSGKTTTLYALLNKLNIPGVKIITLEDPVEYRIDGITQTPVDERAGMTFAMGLRAILRQDPDIVMVGEMRDLETAEIATQAALTGHIVLSTLHTNDAASAIPRLLDLGTHAYALAPAINLIIAQRLVRKICPFCKENYTPAENLMSRVEMILKNISSASKAQVPKKMVFTHSKGCDKCHGLGYKGRIGVYEVFMISETIEQMILKSSSTTEIRRQAITEGMLTMAQDGILKTLEGITDVEEVFRVTEE